MIEIDTTAELDDVPAIPVFSIDGKEYGMPGVIPGNMALRVLELIRTEGEVQAMAWAVPAVLGEEAWGALLDCPTIRKSQVEAIMAVVGEHVMGEVEDTGKAGGNGSGRSGGSWSTPGTSKQTSGRSSGSRQRKR
jgi:hypothetical protein